MILFIDIETFSSVPLPRCGVDRYAESDDFGILLVGYAVDHEPVKVLDLASAGIDAKGSPLNEETKWLFECLRDPAITKVAHNARFERTCLSHYYGTYFSPESWFDTMVLASSCGLPMSLDGVGKALGLSEEEAKMREGKDLIRKFCVPRTPTKRKPATRVFPADDPEAWATFVKYNRRDVEVERTIYERLIKWRPDYSEHKLWVLDQTINDLGFRVDVRLAENAVAIGNDYKARLIKNAQDISGLVNPNSASQVKAWLEETEGITVDSLNKKVIADIESQLSDDRCRELLALRKEFSKSSVSKYEAILRCVCKDDHIRGCFSFDGAGRTGRWSGKLVQLQNLPHDTIPDIDAARQLVVEGDADTLELVYPEVQKTLSMLIRPSLVPEEGHQFLVADFSAIEARVIAWIAGEDWRLDVFRNGGDIYCASASQAFHVPVVKHGVNGELRQVGKVMELACIAEGQLVLTDKGLVPIEDVTLDMRLWDGEDWVEHEGVICMGEKYIMEYDGLKATPDHRVWIEESLEPVPFVIAALSHSHLRRSGDCEPRKTIPMGLCGKARVYDIRNAGRHHRFTVSGKLVHNCGYGGGVGAMKAFGADKLGMSEEEMANNVAMWREASPHVVALWSSLNKAALRCVGHKVSTISTVGHIRFDYEDGVLWMNLPSGRRIAYYGAEIGENKFGEKALTYMGQNQQTKKWTRLETFGGKLAENLTQATARDCLKEAMLRLHSAGFDIRGHVHDEVIVTEPISGRTWQELAELMGGSIDWAPGLPLNADGYACSSYRKD